MKNTKRRIKSVLILFIIWFILITICLFYFTVCSRSEYLRNSNRVLFREGRIAATRGTIFDKNGKRLAWCCKNYDLYLDPAKIHSNKQKTHLLKQLKKIFPNIKLPFDAPYKDKIIIKKNLTPKELISSQGLLLTNSALLIKPVLKRITINIPKVKKYIGTALFINGEWVGLSGVEKEYNSYLNGTDGIYTVMLDKKGRWIEGSGIHKRKMMPGKNLYLKKSIKDIINSS